MLRDHVPGYRLFDDRYAYLFNSYYEAEGPRHARPQRGLHLHPAAGCIKRLCDEKPKAPEELLVDDVVTPRRTSLHALHLQPHQVAQHGTGGFIAAVAGDKKALPKLGVTGEGGKMGHALSLPRQG